jgi:serine protease inhibitor
MADRSAALAVVRLVLAALLFAACHPTVPEGQIVQADVPHATSLDVSDAQVAQLIAGNNAFACDLYHAVAQANDNLIYSPYSIWLAFSMIYAGARGQAEEQMVDVLYFLPQDAHHPALNLVDQRLQSLDEVQHKADSWRVILALPRFGFETELPLHELLPGDGDGERLLPGDGFRGHGGRGRAVRGLCHTRGHDRG